MNQWINVYIILSALIILFSLVVVLYQRSIEYKPDRSFVILIGCIGISGFIYLILSDTNHIIV